VGRISKCISVLFCVAVTASCGAQKPDIIDTQKSDLIDPGLKLSRDDYKNITNLDAYKQESDGAGGFKVSAAVAEPPIPDLAEILSSPKPPKLGETKLVSIAVTDDVPLKDVLIELARLADIDIEVDSGISGGILFRAKDRPFNEVIDRIADMAGLRYTMKNNVLRVERDTPYVQEYPISFLNIDRNSNGNMSVGGAPGGSGGGAAAGGGGGGGGGGSSSLSVASKSDSDFWKQFEEGIKQILSYNQSKRVSGVDMSVQPNAPAPVAAAPAGAPGAPVAAAAAPAPAPPPPAPVPSQSIAGGKAGVDGSFYIMNRQASTLTVSATDRQHEMIRSYLRMVDSNTSSQVLIEAKVVEVTLNDHYQTGINWTNFGGTSLNFAGNLSQVTPDTKVGTPTIALVKNNILGSGVNLSTAVNLLDEFGTTRALSSPRLHAMNNQQAVLSFVENLVYFNVQINTAQAVLGATGQVVTPAQVNVTSTQKSVPVGIVLTLQPSIDAKDNEITLSLRPSLTRETITVDDPGFEVQKAFAISQLNPSGGSIPTSIAGEITALQAIKSTIPQIETRELDSVMKIKSGQTLVVGGLLEDSVTNTDAGIPGASEIPWIGNLFKSVDKVNSKKELVIFIRATVMGTSGGVDKADKMEYQKFMQDPRPLTFDQ